ncbi:hypothetical protein CcaverHIS002_0401330 [Cutaneotrichosporon cavernicola]|uniref:Uncharacterized protein n=1 Tax=Cutaneotrichosporon cavernicola TaxID=279322 RepID=A0AA48L3J2_9TREE|nr:uncharacterized protein CcaverHIS019_0401290 [Cutaneotrichosporon cavernicola]BEI83529.1 hypothetical protein CcaverHIS002_0401330 [Cutaneotrichosporon cavernicola]BEI91309.1 hypothetical protein CcaverHIS019_0401290 [Cutaneotrichosporon cavernicola]BEI99082.1 hypothetical protein CcaverHIS631_0401250 [Cutaneotrichosporon cavernicola]BEJ06856.1 hypothetical protein CcaverHIS641_0401250 [Cutaneotrichosporon cavernicola]
MSLRLAIRPIRSAARPTLARAYAQLDGGDPNTGKWETSMSKDATESEADVRADHEGPKGKPTPAMQEATASEAKKEAAKAAESKKGKEGK